MPSGATFEAEAARPLADHAARLSSSAVFGARKNGALVGMLGLARMDGPKEAHKAFVWGFFVQPEVRGEGVGGALLRAALEAAARIVEQVCLTVMQDNDAAIALYTREGFRTYGVEPRALKEAGRYVDEMLMVKVF